ncbi:ankyrin repeat and KH domain-containing protein 1-like [Pseudomyrmex gracilis]|uniref:ankyrin repeat and KH domain-containing protein 1-like n=1 Tax=Pseudomyrmex gracilis TaxID=219809 RepID=UPI0009957382|nr:ankyrin repeat and KH domain-containing protein 1-like [Pseudomyrmex gracilis]
MDMDYIDTSYRLIRAIREGNLERAREILPYYGLSYSQVWKEGYVLLCDAIENRHTEVIKLLLTYGSKVNSNTGETYNTPLNFAVKNGDIKIVKMLLDRRANVNATTRYGTTPLHNAIVKEKIEIAELLLNHGADVNASDKYGVTPLCLAVKTSHVDGVAMLLDRGANINAISNNDYYDFSSCINCEEIADFLKQHIVKIKAANLSVSEQVLSMSSNFEIRDLQDKCEKEVAIMKNEKISNTNISFYDILIKDTNLLAIYIKNENVVQVLRSDEYKTKFPIYSSMIKNQFRKGMKKKELLEQGTKNFYFFCNFFELPLECSEQIFSYLSDNDIRILIDTCKSVSVSNLSTDINDVEITLNSSKVLCV